MSNKKKDTVSLNKIIRAVKNSDLIITPKLQLFLMRNPNLVLDDSVTKTISEQIGSKPRVRSGSFSSSAAGMCERRQVFNYIGIDSGTVNNPQLQQIFYDGTWRHLRWQATLLQAGILTEIEIPLKWNAKRSRGSMDGLGVVPDDHARPDWRGLEFGFELKGTNSFVYRKAVEVGLKEEHLNQIHRYFLVGGFDLFVVIYENKDNQEWTEWVVTPEPKRLKQQEEELSRLNQAVETETLPVMLQGCQTRNSQEWKQCPFAGNQGVCVQAQSYHQVQQMISNPPQDS
jgi:hypothetical protein